MNRRHFLRSGLGTLAGAALSHHAVAQSGGDSRGPFGPAIENLAEKLERDYVIAATGAKYAALLRRNLARGAYAGIEDAASLAQRLTTELRELAFDGHLRVIQDPGPMRPGSGPGRRPRPAGPAVEDLGWIGDEIAAVRFNELPGTPQSNAATEEFMRRHATAQAIVIDARTLPGGGIGEMDVMLPYLFGRETTLVAMEISQHIFEERGFPVDAPTMHPVEAPAGLRRWKHVVKPHPSEHRLFDARVFFLTSDRTASAGEHFALALKRTHRATLVGGRTAGGNHFGGFEELGRGLSAFIPIGRTLDPDTGKDWEGVGIVPDVEVSPAAALDTALRLAREPATS